MKNSYCPNCKSKISFLNLLFNTSNRCPNCNSNLKIYFLGESNINTITSRPKPYIT